MELEQIRREYLQGGLHRADLHESPIAQFQGWLAQAIAAGINDPTAMTVATVDSEGQPTQRIVLLKDVTESGFVFYTNLGSKKAKDLAENPRISLHFPWHSLERQVKISGVAERLSLAKVAEYFSSRPTESQLAAWASKQSSPVSSRKLLMTEFARMKEKFQQGKVPLPDFWGGFCVKPERIEFWQGGNHRLHDRFEYRVQADQQWQITRLAP